MGGHQPDAHPKNIYETIMDSPTTHDTPFNQSESQESKLLKVRDQLRNEIRTHKHDDIRADILAYGQKIAKLEKDVQLLISIVTSHNNQINSLTNKDASKPDNETNPDTSEESGRIVSGYIVISSAINKMKTAGISRVIANTTTVAEYLVTRGYLTPKNVRNKTHAKFEIALTKDNIIIRNPNYANYGSNTRSGYTGEYMIKTSYVNSVMIPHFLKIQAQIDSLDHGDAE